MKGAIFAVEEVNLWGEILKELDEMRIKIPDKTKLQQYFWNSILSTLKSYRPSPNGNGIKWSKEEKEAFIKLSYKEQRKMIVRKSELKSTLFPYVNVDYEPYKFSDRISDTAKRTYDKANKILESYSKIDFNNLDSKIQQDILHNLRVAYKEQYLKAGVRLSQLLFKKAFLKGGDESRKEIQECNKIVQELMREKIPENSYMYYQLYKWSSDHERLFHTDITPHSLGLLREEALECYNHALECVVWEAIDEEAQSLQKSCFAAELYLAAAIKYQSPLAFYLAAQNYAPSGRTNESLRYALIPYNASLRCAIALGNTEALDTLISNYENGTRMMRQSPLQVNLLESYKKKRAKDLINGLDPYFDEKFSPELIIDLGGYTVSMAYGGTIVYPGISRLIKGENYYNITIKDPRDKDSTPQSIKEYYLKVWEMLVAVGNDLIIFKNISVRQILAYKIYSNLTYGLPSARPYIFPKEVLDIEIDFNKGLEGYGKDRDEG